MKTLNQIELVSLCALLVACGAGDRTEESQMNTDSREAAVVEIVTLKLKEGVSFADFVPIDKAVETEHVSQQPGFISRESVAGDDGEWLVIVHWASVADADASMSTFMDAPAAGEFMNNIDADTMVMKRYSKPE